MGKYVTRRGSDEAMSKMISNPVLRGFNPDPSIIRVGETYYIATSTFEWWPGVRLYESHDMVNWTLLPSPLNRVSQLDMKGTCASGGVWAPDLSYNDGLFWLIFTDVKQVEGAFKDCTNYLVTAENIRGPWSDPIRLNGVGFDPSLFHDGDRKYLAQQTWDFRDYHHTFNGITLTEFDTGTMKLMPETERIIWKGSKVKVTEGPHLYRIGDYYYLFAAEGGTGYEHQESVARSRSLDALSFEAMPNNPLLGNYLTPESYLQKQGHGSLVDTPDGQWYYASLCARPWHRPQDPVNGVRGWCTLGRETSIQKLEWTDDGWPYIVGGQAGQRYVDPPIEPNTESQPSKRFHDDFQLSKLNQEWNTCRVPFSENMGYVGEGCLRLRGGQSLTSRDELSMIARRWDAFNFTAETKVEFNPHSYMQMAGLANYYNDRFWSWIYLTWDEERGCKVIEVSECDRGRYHSYLHDRSIIVPQQVESVWLRTQVDTDMYRYEYSFDGHRFVSLPCVLDARILSDDYVAQSSGGFFTGAFSGLACVDLGGYRREAYFDYYDYKSRDAD